MEWKKLSGNFLSLLQLSLQVRLNYIDSLFQEEKTEYLKETAARVMNGTIDQEALQSVQSLDELEKQLTKIRGIGAWTANYVIMRCLRHPSAFPAGDAGLQNAVKKLLELDRKPDEARLKMLASDWKGWEAYACFYLWQAL